MYAIIILKGKFFNFTYASVRFDQYGQQTDYPIIVCDDWRSGFDQAKQQNHKRVLFCDSGTVFKNINEFLKQIDNYPHQGLIGHIIDPLTENEYFSLHPQCFLLDLNKFSDDCFDNGEIDTYDIIRSNDNIHHNYTPLWIRAGENKIKMNQTKFGQKLIAQQLNNKSIVSNWHQKLRDNKIYLYRAEIYDSWVALQQEYINIAEQQLWITNNQDLSFNDTTHLISPASGLFWIMSAVTRSIDKITLVDISKPQIELARSLIDTWDGINYSEFVFNFVKHGKLKHLQFDQPVTPLEQLQLQKKEHFCQRVDNIFQQQLKMHDLTDIEFQESWKKIKNIQINIINDNIVSQINSRNIILTSDCTLWISNILDYKYTWLKSDLDEIDMFNVILKSSGARVIR
jgi:hypothetical protein